MDRWNERDTYTAWELCGDWAWTKEFKAKLANGRAVWYEVVGARGYRTVRLTRMDGGETVVGRPHQITRYVGPDTPMKLVRD